MSPRHQNSNNRPMLAFLSFSSSSSTITPLTPSSAHRQELYSASERNLAQRLDSLLSSSSSSSDGGGGAHLFSLAFLANSFTLLLDTLFELLLLYPHPLSQPLSPCHKSIANDFFHCTADLLDVCRAINNYLPELRKCQTLLKVAMGCLGGGAKKAGLRRGRKILRDLLWAMGEEVAGESGGEEGARGSLCRWSRNSQNSTRHSMLNPNPTHHSMSNLISNPSPAHHSTANPAFQLQALSVGLVVHRCSRKEDHCSGKPFATAMYAFTRVSILFLSIAVASMPASEVAQIAVCGHLGNFLWSVPLLSLQEKVSNETRKGAGRRRNNGKRTACEVDRICGSVRDLFQLITLNLVSTSLSATSILQDAIQDKVNQLQQYGEELEKGLGPMEQGVKALLHHTLDLRVRLLHLIDSAGS